jgi:hypothetical protein
MHAKMIHNDEAELLRSAMGMTSTGQRIVISHHHHQQQQQQQQMSSAPMNLLQGYRIQNSDKPKVIDYKNIPMNKQTDGANDNDSSDEDDVKNTDADIAPASSPDPFDVDDDDDDEDSDSNKKFDDEDPNPINSGDDVSDDDPQEVFETENVVICQYDKLSRVKTNWKFQLKDGIMNLNGKDYLFSRATGDAAW